jgi:hypothetical protein
MSPFMRIGDRWVGPSEYRPGVHALTADEIEFIVSLNAKMAGLARRLVSTRHRFTPAMAMGWPNFYRLISTAAVTTRTADRSKTGPAFVRIRKAVGRNAGDDFPVWIKMNPLTAFRRINPDQAAEYTLCWRKQAMAPLRSPAALSAATIRAEP